MVFLALAFGVALATKLVSLVASIPRHDPVGLPDWTVVAALVVIALGFTVLLRAHLRDTPWILLAGALGFGASRIGAVTLGPELATFLGALTVGMASNLYGRVLHRPEAVTLIPGILLLVPGSIGFRSLSWLIEREVVIGVENAFLMILLAAGLVAGLLVANVVIPPRR